MSRSMNLDGKIAVITGAGGGIGRALARSLARRGCNVALCDVDEAGLAETARLVGNGVQNSVHVLDVSDRDAVAALPDAVIAAHGAVDIVVNNAGIALGGGFGEISTAQFDRVMAVNFDGVVSMTRAFLPHLEQRTQARIVNLSSLFGLIAPPGQSAYAASKFAVRGFSEALRNELEAAGSPVGVTVLHPGGVRTNIAANATIGEGVDPETREKHKRKFEKALVMDPAEAGEIIARGIEAQRPRVLVGKDAKIVSVIERIMPVGYWRLLGRRL
ncbi:SDR family NAD(P)-dependent oxidoreductase [Croceicoccus hydrothermalis]|uniref:SDR family NAD(P)-dependent oxidoreductase n=1 Tax=Croceicoccus hydrothermalis TaxID=2867964 RepID=UPI001EFBA5C2|nr:SDR family NAD(P)-dependent oxidoreductase [Croceicoccus hydrothermalis]